MKTKDKILERVLFIASFTTTLFFLFAYLNYKLFHLDFIVINFFHELLMIPFLIAQPILVFHLLLRFFKEKCINKLLGYLCFVLLMLSITLVWGSLLFYG